MEKAYLHTQQKLQEAFLCHLLLEAWLAKNLYEMMWWRKMFEEASVATPETSVDVERYGFNVMEKDGDVNGSESIYDFGARLYDGRIGRWFSVDPLASKYPFASPYNFVLNTPIQAIDPDGKVVVFVLLTQKQAREVKAKIEKLRSDNIYFDALYSALDNSNYPFALKIDDQMTNPGQFRAGQFGGGQIAIPLT